jgi:hypothetical protein
MRATSFLLVLLLTQPVQVSQSLAARQELDKKLVTHIETYDLSADTFLQALTKVAAQFQLPMGIEWVKAPAHLTKVNFSWQQATVYQILESVVKSQPGYDLDISNGMVHVSPRGFLTDPHNFLNLRVDEFGVQDEFIGVASRRLRDLVRRIVSPPASFPLEGEAGSLATGMGDHRVSFKLKDAAVRDILDRLSSAADLKVWIVTYPQEPRWTPSGFRRTISLYRAGPIPDEYQPEWIFLPCCLSRCACCPG